MSIFEYSSSILAIVLALAIGNLLSGLALTIKYSSKDTRYWVHTAWSLIILVTIVGFFWAAWRALNEVEILDVWRFLLGPFAACSLFYVTSRILLPEATSDGLPSLEQHFLQVRKAFYLMLGTTFLVINGVIPLLINYWTPLVETILGVALICVAYAGVLCKTPNQHKALVVVWAGIYLIQELLQLAIS